MPRHPAFTGSRIDAVGHAVPVRTLPVTRNWAWCPGRYALTAGGFRTVSSAALVDFRASYLLTLRHAGR